MPFYTKQNYFFLKYIFETKKHYHQTGSLSIIFKLRINWERCYDNYFRCCYEKWGVYKTMHMTVWWMNMTVTNKFVSFWHFLVAVVRVCQLLVQLLHYTVICVTVIHVTVVRVLNWRTLKSVTVIHVWNNCLVTTVTNLCFHR